MNFLKYILQEVKNRQLSHLQALEFVRQYQEGAGAAASARPCALHSLLHVNTSDLKEQRYTTHFSGQEFFLTDHVVHGQKILPGVVYLEMARAALDMAEGAPRESGMRLLNVVWQRPLVVVQHGAEVHIGLHPQADGQTSFRIYGSGGEVYCQGIAEVLKAGEPERIDLDELRQRCVRPVVTGEACYERLALLGLVLGPAHQAINIIHVGDDLALANLRLPASVEGCGSDFLLHPSLMDSALQTIAGLPTVAGQASLGLPFGVESVEIFGPCTRNMWALARPAHDNSTRSLVGRFDVILCDEQGVVCVRFRGLSIRSVIGLEAQGSPSLGMKLQPGSPSLLAPVWEPMSPSWMPILPSYRHLLVVGGGPAQLGALRQHFGTARLTVLAADCGHEEMVSALAVDERIDHVIWIALGASGMAVMDDDMISGQQRGVLPFFRLIKALLAAGYDQNALDWSVFTTGVYAVGPDEVSQPVHAGLHGLVGVMAKEYPAWQVRLIDLPNGEFGPLVQALSLSPDANGDSWAWRNGHWYRQELLPFQIAPEHARPYRQGGVCVVIGGAGGIGEAWSNHVICEYGAQVVWIGRRPLDARIQAKIDKLASLGPAPHYISADATDRQSLQDAHDEVLRRFGRISGVIHSALVLSDQSLALMDEAQFTTSLAAKVDVCVRMAQVFGGVEPGNLPDFVLFFSSMQSFAKAAGQSNYAAGCVFKDSFALRLEREWACRVRVMNWGWWGSVGVVASEPYRDRMSQLGLLSIESDEGMTAIHQLLSSPIPQLALLKVSETANVRGIRTDETLHLVPAAYPSLIPMLNGRAGNATAPIGGEDRAQLRRTGQEVDAMLCRMLLLQLQSLGLCPGRPASLEEMADGLGIGAFYHRWLTHTLQLLCAQGFLHFDGRQYVTHQMPEMDAGALWIEWEARKAAWLEVPAVRAQVVLLDATLRALPGILRGKVLATEVMFPDSSMHLVEGIYKSNPVADYFNAVLADAVVAFVEERLEQDSTSQVRILEVGAGTGGSSALLFERLRPYAAHIGEYCYTDVSRAFLIHAETNYGPTTPYLRYQLFDVGRSPAEQGLQLGSYDLVVATNVLHATRNIRMSVRHAKALLRTHGLLMLNEISSNHVMAHLTFGLLEGWWLYEDGELRIAGCPGLYPTGWQSALGSEGYRCVQFPAEHSHELGQQIVVAESDGVIRQASVAPSTTETAGSISGVQPEAGRDGRIGLVSIASKQQHEVVSDDELADHVRGAVLNCISDALKVGESLIQEDRSFSEYGVDSILSVGLVKLINKRLGLKLQTTILFDHNNVHRLVDHITCNYKTELQTQQRTEPQAKDLPRVSIGSGTAQIIQRFKRAEREVQSVAQPSDGQQHYHRILIDGPGRIADLKLVEALVPELQDDEVRISVRAFALNFADLLCVSGLYPTMPAYPFTAGFEASGVVVAVGRRVTSVHCGQDVVVLTGPTLGAHATLLTCKATHVFAKPASLSHEQACSLPVVALTMIDAFRKAQPRKGEKILIQTAAGGTGLLAVQLAKHHGAEIYVTAGSQHKLDYLKTLGVHHLINYVEDDFEAEVQRLTGGKGIDVVINTLPGDAIQKGLNCLSSGGRYIEIAMAALKSARAIDLSVLNDNQSFFSVDLGRLLSKDQERLRDYVAEMHLLLEQSVIQPVISKVFPFEGIQAAHHWLGDRKNIGKVVVGISEPYRYFDVVAGGPKILLSKPSVLEREPIAIIGMSGRFAQSPNIDVLWAHLANGDDLIEEATRWDLSPLVSGAPYCKEGGFVPNIDQFDPQFFNISGQEAVLMDPQQRIFLEESWAALEDAGYVDSGSDGRRCGVYVGCTGSDYVNLFNESLPPQAMWGNANSILPARIAYYLNLHGPAVAIDTACSSSLVAAHMACQSLWGKETDLALVGGVAIHSTAGFHESFGAAGMLSPNGRCYAFDDRANGFVPGEGVGAVVLKRLSEAMADGDHIYGVIRGSAINQDGTTNGITAPSALSQERLEIEVYERFNIDPGHIQMVEAHGTGTKLGDPIEFGALTRSFRHFTDKARYCAIGSIKTNLGHTIGAAGIAGMVKVLLSFKHKQIPPSLHFEKGNADIEFEGSPFYVNTSLRDWDVAVGERRSAAISSFGISGTNAHLVLEEAPQTTREHIFRPAYLIALSARTSTQLRQQVSRLLAHCERNPDIDFGDLSYTLLLGRRHFSHRLACVIRHRQELLDWLGQWLEVGVLPQVSVGEVSVRQRREKASLTHSGQACIERCRRGVTESYQDDLATLAGLHVQGEALPWEQLFVNGRYGRLSLPTYPFARERYWVESSPIRPKLDRAEPIKEVPDDMREAMLLHPVWSDTPLLKTNGSPLVHARHLVLLGDDRIDVAALSAQLVGIDCMSLVGSYVEQAEALLTRLQQVLQAKVVGSVLVQLVVPESGSQQLTAGLAALLKSAHLECPRLIGQLIKVDQVNDLEWLAARLGENALSPQDGQVRYVRGSRQVLKWVGLHADDVPSMPWKVGGVYLITGGLGGLGRIFAKEIARQAPGATLVLTGRRALKLPEQQVVRELEALGVTVQYEAVDVADQKAVDKLVQRILQDRHALHGIIHSAGVISDGLLLEKSPEVLRSVLSAKVLGLVNLDKASRDIDLDCFICFSSLAAIRGNVGQADYAAGNAFMDAYASYRSQLASTGLRQGRMLSVNWPLWQDGGMQLDAAVARALAQTTGMVAMSSEVGVRAMYQALSSGLDQVAVISGDHAKLAEALFGDEPAAQPPVVLQDADTALAVDPGQLRDKVRLTLRQLVSSLLKIQEEDIHPDAEFSEHGFDSWTLKTFTERLNQDWGTQLAPTLLFEFPTINSLVDHLVTEHYSLFSSKMGGTLKTVQVPASATDTRQQPPAAVAAPSATPPNSPSMVKEPIAIIGISGSFPQAADINIFWKNLAEGKDCITEIPADRWDWNAYFGDPATEQKTRVKWGGFIDDVGDFDPLFFGISPKEAKQMDPQQRLLMLHVWRALEDAGYSASSLAGSNTAIFVGTGSTGYNDLLQRGRVAIEGYTSTGIVPSVGPNRMSYFLDLHGPSQPIETACSSSLVAIRRGVMTIENGESDMAIVGGVNTLLSPDAYISFSKAGMLSEDGRCKTFSGGANGYVRGEGVGMLLLKRLSAAERDGDHIYGLIRGTAENHGGRANSLTAPNPKAQAELIKSAYRQSGVDPRSVGYIEVHGTGTPLGDPVEVNGLKLAFRDLYADSGITRVEAAHCGIGSVKSNIGHLELAAGMAGVIKVLLQMKHKTLVPSLHCDPINPYVELDGSPFYIVRETQEWVAPIDAHGKQQPRRAGISSFGFGGVNTHVVLEEYLPTVAARTSVQVDIDHPVLILLSAKNAKRLQDRVRQLLEAIRAGVVTQGNLADVAYTLQLGRDAMDSRLALVTESVDDLRVKLEAFTEGRSIDYVYRGDLKRNHHEAAIFASVEESERMLTSWLSEQSYGNLLALWVKGLVFDWGRLYRGQGVPQRHRVSLPTYPFALERYWVPDPASESGVASGNAFAASRQTLVRCITSESSGRRYLATLKGDEFFLADHVLRGSRVLPAVMYLELLREAICLEMGRQGACGLKLNRVAWVRPMVVEDGALDVHIGLQLTDEGWFVYEVFSETAGERRVYSQGQAKVVAESTAVEHDLEHIKKACSETMSVEHAYEQCKRMGVSHGPAYRVLAGLYRGEGLVLARLVLPQVALSHGRFELHPCLMDGALQSLMGFVDQRKYGNQTSLPFALRELEVLASCSERMWVVGRFSAGSSAADRVQKFDLDLCDDDGRICVRFKEFTTRVLADNVGRAPAETLFLQPEWRTEPAALGEPAAIAGHLVLLIGSRVKLEALSSCLEGARCVHLQGNFCDQAEGLLEQLQTLMPGRSAVPLLVQLVVPHSNPQSMAMALSGMLKSAQLEHPKMFAQVIAIDCNGNAKELAARLLESRCCPQDKQIRYACGERQVLRWREVTDVKPEKPWRPGGVYIITGGLGGLGRIFASEIARQAAGATLVLTGRRELDEEDRQQIRELEVLGARVDYRRVDVADREAVRQLVLQVNEDHEDLNGIVHSAGVIRDGLLMKKTPKDLQEVLAAKVAGLINLDEASRDIDIDWLICFSSLAAVHGNVGQGDYATANAFMDSYAAYRNTLVATGQRQGRTLSVNWPLWQDGGMQIDASAAQILADASGMMPLPTASGIRALYSAMASGLDQVVVIEGEAERIRQALGGATARQAPGPQNPPSSAILQAGIGSDVRDKAGRYFRKLIASALSLSPQEIEIDAPLEKYGINSLMVTNLTAEMERVFGPLSKTLFFEYQTLEALSDYFVENHAAQLLPLLTAGRPAGSIGVATELVRATAAVSASASAVMPVLASMSVALQREARGAIHGDLPNTVTDDVAIIGIAGQYPQAQDLDAYWRNLRDGVDCITEIPKDRWDHTEYFDLEKGKPGKAYTKWGGFIEGVAEFDPLFFNLLPRDAEMASPQERLFLQCAYSAIEDAGYTRETLARYQSHGLSGNVGVYVGVMYEEYQLFAAQQQLLGHPVTVSGSPASIANRVSYFLNLHGPSMAIDTMCSSALTAIHLACESLQRGNCELAIAGGVNVSIHPNKYLMLSQGRFASSKGQCESFGVGGDGYVPGEGVGAVILKSLRQAAADGDHIYGVIKATAINHGGKTNGYTVPNPVAQANVIARTLKAAGIHPRMISYVEAHGTGTSLGDPIEIAGLSKAYAEFTSDRQFCALGSVKSNIGHSESAAGIAGLTKVLLQMKHGQLVPSLHSRELNPNIDFSRTPFVVQQELAPWMRPEVEIDGVRREYPRIAGLSSFGAGGSNAHLIIEEWSEGKSPNHESGVGRPALVVLSAKDSDRLQFRVRQLLDAVERGDVTAGNLADAAYTLQTGREAMDARLAMLVDSVESLGDKLRQALQGNVGVEEVYRGDAKRNKEDMSLLSSDEDLAGLIAGWITKGRYGRLLEMWVRGLRVDWNLLYSDDQAYKPRRVSLPTYPFAKERYWLPGGVEAIAHVTGLLNASSAKDVLEPPRQDHDIHVLLRPEWRVASATETDVPVYEEHLVFLCDKLVEPEVLSSCLGSARCVVLPNDYVEQASIILEQMQALLLRKPSALMLVQVVTSAFRSQQLAAGLAGLLRSARPECPRLIGQVIVIDSEEDAPQLAEKLRDNARCPQDLQIRYDEGERQLLGWTDVVESAPLQPWKPGGVYLITGGLGGLGRIFAEEIAKQVRDVTLVLTGRRQLDDAGRQSIRELEALGAKVEYHSVDVVDREAVRQLILQVREDHEVLNGILHSAGVVMNDRLFMKTTQAELGAVLAPKVTGLVNLDEASRDIDLDWLICFSSTSAVLGVVGHADYAAANAFMDSYTSYRNGLVAMGQRHGRSLSVNWHLWLEGGMKVDAAIERAMQRQTGAVAIRRDSGVQALYRVYGSGLDQVAVVAGDPVRIRRMFSNLAKVDTRTSAPLAVESTPRTNHASPDSGGLVNQVSGWLIDMAASLAKVKPERIDAEVELHEYGFDSIMVAELGKRLHQTYQIELTPTVFFQYPTLDGLARHLVERYPEAFATSTDLLPVSAPPQSMAPLPAPLPDPEPKVAPQGQAVVRAASSDSEPIAIIGITGRFPQADDLDVFWQNLQAGRDCVTEVPVERWDVSAYFDPHKGALGKTYSRWGGFVDRVEEFDALFFNIAPREAQVLDVQTRLYLQTVWNLLERSGQTREGLRQRYQGKIGLYVGAMPQPAVVAADDLAGVPLAAPSDVANRVSHFFNFEGPSLAIDTMCSSTMMAIHMACKDLRDGECGLAVVGGVNLPLSPARFVGLSQIQQAGSHAACRSFAQGDGYLPAEAVGAVLLKPLNQAIADGETILAVIKGTATRHSGRSTGYGVSNPNAQARVIEDCLERAGVAPSSITYVEAAATGSALADAIEVAALNTVFGAAGREGWRCPLGAVKSGLGHPEWASGVAQLAKVLLQLQHRQLVPLVAVGTPNAQLGLDETPFYLQRELEEWKSEKGADGKEMPRRALINSFGAGGTYVCVIVEEYLPPPTGLQQHDETHGAQLFVFSGKNDERLRAVLEQSLRQLEGDQAINLRDLAYTLQLGREAMDSRLTIVASTRQELAEHLRAKLDASDSTGVPVLGADRDAMPHALQHLLTGTTGNSMVEVLLAEQNLEGLGLYWAQGSKVPWEKLHVGKVVRKIPWPTYPFARTVCSLGAAGALKRPTEKRTLTSDKPASMASGAAGETPARERIGALLVEALSSALGIPMSELPIDKPLAMLGYKSIAAMELKYRLEAILGCSIALELIGDGNRSIAELSSSLTEHVQSMANAAGVASPVLPILVSAEHSRHELFPLTDMQEAFLLGRRQTLEGDRTGAHIYAEIEVGGALDIFRLNHAWNRLVAHHGMLRAVFVDGSGQQILPSVRDYRFKVLDLRRLDEGRRMSKADALRNEMEHHVFSGATWPLFDIRVAIHGDGLHTIHFSIDELIVDGLSVDTLVRQWDQLYAQPDLVLPPMDISFRDYVLAMKGFEASDKYRRDLTYWLDRLEDLPGGPSFPRSLSSASGSEARRCSRLYRHLPASDWTALQAKATALGISPSSLLLGVFAEVLRAWTDSPTFTLVLTYFNRPPLHPQIRELIGPAISSLLFVVEPRGSDDLGTIVQGHHQRLWQDLDHSSVSGIQVLRQLRSRAGRSGRRNVPTALPVVFTSMLGSDVNGEPLLHLGNVAYAVNQTPQVFLDHQVRESAGGLDCSWDIAEGRFEPGYIRALFDTYCQTLAGFASGRLEWALSSLTRPAAEVGSKDPVTAQLAGLLAQVQREDALGAFEPFPLNDQQQAYAFGRDTRLEGGGGSCQFYQELLVDRLDVVLLEQALATLLERHPALRTVVQADGTQVVLAKAPPYSIKVTDLRMETAERRRVALKEIQHDQLCRAAPLGEWPYFAVMVSLLEGDTACVHLCFDLILVDSTSIGLLLHELIQLYQQPQLKLQMPLLTFRDYQQAVERFKGMPAYTERLEYWSSKFADLSAGPELPQQPTDRAIRSDIHQRISGEMKHWRVLKQYAADHGTEPGLILLTAYLEVLYAWNGMRPLTVVVPGWDRLPVHPDIGRIVGDFTILSWVTRGSKAMSFQERLEDVLRQHAEDLAQRPVSGLQVLRRMMLRNRRRQLRFPVVFTNQIAPQILGETTFRLGDALSKTPQVYLDNLSGEAGSSLLCSWDFEGGVYAPAMISEMFNGYMRLLELLGSDPLAWNRTDFGALIRARPAIFGVESDRTVVP